MVLAIPPFNYPVNLAVSKIAPALMAGNAVVLKPPTQGAIAGIHMAQCFHKAGLPKGILNVITGRGSEIGDFLTQHPMVNCISFTGGDTGVCRDCFERFGVGEWQWQLPDAAPHGQLP